MRALDTYVGRNIEEIGGTENEWYVILEGGIRITCNSDVYTLPFLSNNVGMKFVSVIMDSDTTTMVLNDGAGAEWRIVLDPVNYQIFDATQDPTSWFPQVTVPYVVPPWPFDE